MRRLVRRPPAADRRGAGADRDDAAAAGPRAAFGCGRRDLADLRQVAGAPRGRDVDPFPRAARRGSRDRALLTMAAPLHYALITPARITRRRIGVLTFVI